MALQATEEGTIPFNISTIASPCSTYYKIYGDLSCGKPPVVILHGGPGAGHEYLLPYAELWTKYGFPVIFYDQIGCASSTHLPQTMGDESFWQESLFIDELNNVVEHFNLRGGPGFHLFGHSWGAMFGASFAARYPEGLRRLVLASGLASKELSLEGYQALVDQIPGDVGQEFKEALRKGEYDTPAYHAGMDVFYKQYLCREQPFPPAELLPALKNLAEDKTVYGTLFGPSVMARAGSLIDWTSIPNLPNIKAPTLVFNGEHDTSHDMATVPYFELIPRVRWITFANGGHMCHLESGLREKVLKVVGGFLKQDITL